MDKKLILKEIQKKIRITNYVISNAAYPYNNFVIQEQRHQILQKLRKYELELLIDIAETMCTSLILQKNKIKHIIINNNINI